MYLELRPVLHIDERTRFTASLFLRAVSTKSIWQTFLTYWSAINTRLSHKILVDQGTAFSRIFKTLWALTDVQIQSIGTEAHYFPCMGERYHEPLRTPFRKLKITYPSVSPEFILSCSTKAMKGTLSSEGLVPSALVYVEYPSVRTISKPSKERPTLSSRADISMTARK